MDNNIPRNIFQELIGEVIQPENINIDSIKFNDELNPILWDENKQLKNDVRKTLLKNVKFFIEFADINNIKISDIILTGSMANYNYTKHSDIDVHIVFDFTQISDDVELVENLLKTKKKLWEKTKETQIKGHDIELYFQNKTEPHHSTGVYSILYNKWIREPVQKVIDVDVENLKQKTHNFINKIMELEKIKDSEDFLLYHDLIKEKLKKYRQSGLNREGEFSTENMVFKLLRNLGFIERFFKMKNDFLTKKLSLNQ